MYYRKFLIFPEPQVEQNPSGKRKPTQNKKTVCIADNEVLEELQKKGRKERSRRKKGNKTVGREQKKKQREEEKKEKEERKRKKKL